MVVDDDSRRIQEWASEYPPVFEPDLLALVHEARNGRRAQGEESQTSKSEEEKELSNGSTDGNGTQPNPRHANLTFSTNIDDGIRQADIIVLCVDTPQSVDNDGFGARPDLTNLHRAAERVGQVATKQFILVEKSTVPCGSARYIREIIDASLSADIGYEVVSNPEFLAQGSAVQDLLNPDRVLIGSSETPSGLLAAHTIVSLYEKWVPKERIFTVDNWSAELSKLCANALHAQRISSINSISMVCEELDGGADIRNISRALQLDHRIGPYMMNASPGFGGSCFGKDVAHLVYLARRLRLDIVANYWQAVLDLNNAQKDRFATRIINRLGDRTLQQTTIAILGLAFKAGTNDCRNSPTIATVKELSSKPFKLRIYDPQVPPAKIRATVGSLSLDVPTLSMENVEICKDAQHACTGAHAVAILTEWDEFRYESSKLEGPGVAHSHRRWQRIAELMQEPKYIFDGRNIIANDISELGFRVERIGKAAG